MRKKSSILVKRKFTEETESGVVINEFEEDVFLEENKESVFHGYSGLFCKLLLCREPNFSKPSFEFMFTKLFRYLFYGNKLVLHTGANNRRALSDDDLMKILNCKKSTYYVFIKECFNKGFLSKYSYRNKQCYIVNPAYAYVGANITMDIFGLFEEDLSFLLSLSKETKKELYEKKKINVDELIYNLNSSGTEIYSKRLGEGIFDGIKNDENNQI